MKEQEMVIQSVITYDAFLPFFVDEAGQCLVKILDFGADFFLSFKKWKERLKLLNCKVKVPLVTGAIWVSRTRQEKLTMLCSPSYFRTYFWGVSHTFLQKQTGNFLRSTFIFRNNVTAVISGYLINPNWTGEWCNAPCPLKGLVTPESSTVKILYVVLSTFKANFVN